MNTILWQIAIGLGIFLYGMSCLEQGIRDLGDARLRRWLANSTRNPLSSTLAGAAITAILQSSSMVSLLVLAFASAGVIPLYNGIGVILGANLGTTITGWLVATLGFKLDLDAVALPLIGFGGMLHVMLGDRSRIVHWGRTALGLGLLLFGLSLMKASVDSLPQRFDISMLQGYHPVVYLLTGTLLAALIQSSSASVMMTLAALHGGLISLPEAGALVIGADLGTTSTTLLGSLTGPGIKRQLAMSHVIFNVVVDIGAFVLLLPLLPAAVEFLHLSDPLYGLVAFHSTINLIGVLAFLPLLGIYSRWISARFKTGAEQLPVLSQIPVQVPEAALAALRKYLLSLWLIAMRNNLSYFSLHPGKLKLSTESMNALRQIQPNTDSSSSKETYEQIKQREVEILRFSFGLQQQPLTPAQAAELLALTEMTRSIVYCSKTLRDISRDLHDIAAAVRHSDSVAWMYSEHQHYQRELLEKLLPLMTEHHNPQFAREILEKLDAGNNAYHEKMNLNVQQRLSGEDDQLISLSTLLNVNHEIHHATRSLLHSVATWIRLTQPGGSTLTGEVAGNPVAPAN